MLKYNKIYLGDCLEYLKLLPDKSVNLVLTDPPYGINVSNSIGRRKNGCKTKYKKINWDKRPPLKIYFDEIMRVSKNQIIFGANHFINLIPFPSPCWLVWDKLLSPELSFAACELAWTSFNFPLKKYALLCNQNKNKIHPTQKPLQLFQNILRDFAHVGDVILDCFSGSGTMAIACHNLDLDFICIEKDYDFWYSSTKRYMEHISQMRLLNV